jgi:hypothetical protein
VGHLSISESLGAYLQHDVINFTLLSSQTLEVVLLCSDARDGVVAIACMSGHMMSRLRDDAVTSDSSLITMQCVATIFTHSTCVHSVPLSECTRQLIRVWLQKRLQCDNTTSA